MEEINLKEIAGYLPYEVGIEITNYKCDYVGIKDSTICGYYFLDGKFYFNYIGGSTGKSINDCKIKLRPLSDLTKEIQIDEYFTTFLGHLLRDCCNENIDDNRVSSEGNNYTITDREEGWFSLDFDKIDMLDYVVVKWLYKNHFDIHGLICKGIAIDINTL